MFHEFPYTNFSEMNLDWLLCMCKKNNGLHLAVVGDTLRLLNANNEVISNVTISYAEKALKDASGRNIDTYIFDAGTNGDTIVFTHGNNVVTSITVPYAEKAKYDINRNEITDYVYNVQVAGQKLRVTKGDGTIMEITVPFATAASEDDEGNVITTYACELSVDGNEIVLRDRKGRVLNHITVPYATKALQDADGDQIDETYAVELLAGTTTIKLINKDGDILSEITVPFATEATHAVDADHADLADDATNAVESVSIVGDQMIFTTYGGTQYTIMCPYSVKAQKDDAGNVIKSTYVANVTADPATGEISFLDATGAEIISIIPQVEIAKKDTYGNLIADYIKQILVDVNSNYVTVVHGTGTTESLIINYASHAFSDINDQAIHNTYISYLTCVEDVQDGHYKLVAWNGDVPKAELFRLEIYAYAAQCDVNGRELTSYVGNVLVDEDDDTKIDVLDGENNPINVIAGQVTSTADGVISGTDVTLTPGTLPSISYDSATETLIFNHGIFPDVDTVTDGTFTGTPVTSDVNFSDSN